MWHNWKISILFNIIWYDEIIFSGRFDYINIILFISKFPELSSRFTADCKKTSWSVWGSTHWIYRCHGNYIGSGLTCIEDTDIYYFILFRVLFVFITF